MLLYAFMIIYANLAISTSSANWQPSVARVPALMHQAAPVVMLPVVPKSGLNWLSGMHYDVVTPPLFPGSPFFIHTYKVCLTNLPTISKALKAAHLQTPFAQPWRQSPPVLVDLKCSRAHEPASLDLIFIQALSSSPAIGCSTRSSWG